MAEQDDDARVQEIRARLEAATPGPWQTWPDGTEESVESVSVGRFVCHMNSNMRQFREDATFIANAREDVPYLLARLDALTAERDEYAELVQRVSDDRARISDDRKQIRRERDVLRVERDIARRVEQESSAAADAWQAEAVKVRGERDAIQAAWNRDKVLTDEAIDHHMARWKQAEAERDALAARLAEAESALRQGIELGEAWERVSDPEAAGEWSMYLLPDFMEASRAALAARPAAQEGRDGE